MRSTRHWPRSAGNRRLWPGRRFDAVLHRRSRIGDRRIAESLPKPFYRLQLILNVQGDEHCRSSRDPWRAGLPGAWRSVGTAAGHSTPPSPAIQPRHIVVDKRWRAVTSPARRAVDRMGRAVGLSQGRGVMPTARCPGALVRLPPVPEERWRARAAATAARIPWASPCSRVPPGAGDRHPANLAWAEAEITLH